MKVENHRSTHSSGVRVNSCVEQVRLPFVRVPSLVEFAPAMLVGHWFNRRFRIARQFLRGVAGVDDHHLEQPLSNLVTLWYRQSSSSTRPFSSPFVRDAALLPDAQGQVDLVRGGMALQQPDPIPLTQFLQDPAHRPPQLPVQKLATAFRD